MLQFGKSEHDLLTGNNVPSANLHRKLIYLQMTLTIAGDPTGKGVHMELPICIVSGVCEMFPLQTAENTWATWKIEWWEIDSHRN